MINYILFTGMFFVIAFFGQYRLKTMKKNKEENAKKIRSMQFITMMCHFIGAILCFVYLFNNA